MMEMDLKLTAVEYVVFDEADRYNVKKNKSWIPMCKASCIQVCTELGKGTFSAVSVEYSPTLGKRMGNRVVTLIISYQLVN